MKMLFENFSIIENNLFDVFILNHVFLLVGLDSIVKYLIVVYDATLSHNVMII